MRGESFRTLSLHALFLGVVLGLWEWGARVGWIDPSFMGSPLGIIRFTLENLTNARLWGCPLDPSAAAYEKEGLTHG